MQNINKLNRFLLDNEYRESEARIKALVWYFVPAVVVGILALIISLLMCCKPAQAEICEKVGVRCIMGEARGEKADGLLAHAYALQNRGHTKGVYGCKAKFSEPDWVWEMARQAWRQAKNNPGQDTTHGATYWGSLIVDQKWIKKMKKNNYIKTAVIRNTVFYREAKK